MRESARLPGHPTSGSSPTGTRVFIQRAEARTRFARSSRMAGEFGDLTLASLPARKMANTTTTNYFVPFVSSSHPNQSAFLPGIGPEKRTIDAGQYRADKRVQSHLRYYTRTQIIQGQIWVPNEVEFIRAVSIEDSLIWTDISIYFPIYDNDDNGNSNLESSKMRS